MRICKVDNSLTYRLSTEMNGTERVYVGVFGAFLAILHTGHKYQSPLGSRPSQLGKDLKM